MDSSTPQRQAQLLICDDDSLFHMTLKHALKGKFGIRSAYNGDEALAIIRNHEIDLVLLDIQMRSLDEGLQYIEKIRKEDAEIAIVMTSGLTDFKTVKEAMKRGATDYLSKEFNVDELPLILSQALDFRSLVQRKNQQNYEVASTQNRHTLVGNGPQMQAIQETLKKFKRSSGNVLITGETGTGKEAFARQLRATLPDQTLAPFVTIDSSTIQSTMAESILFGHEKGAFTGAIQTMKGIFEQAHGGIIYFDEIGNMPLEIQAKLLRVLQEKEVVRIGSSKVIQLDFRVVCATNKNLEAMVRDGLFKDDLLQRINVLPFQIPPLRKRTEDIPALLSHFAQNQASSGPTLEFTEGAISLLKAYPWPGNIRELGNLVAFLTAMVDGSEVDCADLPPRMRDIALKTSVPAPGQTTNYYEKMSQLEREILGAEFEAHQGNVSKMAIGLSMDRSHLYSKLKQHGIYRGSK